MSQQIYYATLRVADHGRHPFGEIQGGQMQLSEAGQILVSCWQNIAQQETQVSLDAFVVMPNHLHGLLMFGSQPLAIGTGFMGNGFGQSALQSAPSAKVEPAGRVHVEAAIDRFLEDSAAILKVDINGKLWHKPYDLQLIQSDKKLNALRHAIYKNPANWLNDRLYAK